MVRSLVVTPMKLFSCAIQKRHEVVFYFVKIWEVISFGDPRSIILIKSFATIIENRPSKINDVGPGCLTYVQCGDFCPTAYLYPGSFEKVVEPSPVSLRTMGSQIRVLLP